LRLAFAAWAGEKWILTGEQLEALKNEARKIGIPVFGGENGYSYSLCMVET
jgi:hypothetical protein